MPTLAQLIAAHEAAQPAPNADEPIPFTLAVMTPRGLAVSQVVRLEQVLADLNRADRAYIVGRLSKLLADVTATTA